MKNSMQVRIEEAIYEAEHVYPQRPELIKTGSTRYYKGEYLVGKSEGLLPRVKILIIKVVNHVYVYLVIGTSEVCMDFDKWIEDNFRAGILGEY